MPESAVLSNYMCSGQVEKTVLVYQPEGLVNVSVCLSESIVAIHMTCKLMPQYKTNQFKLYIMYSVETYIL